MCAIFGAADMGCFRVLYAANLSRGDFAFSCLSEDVDTYSILKQKDKYQHDIADIGKAYYAGHTQAPTSSAQTFDASTSHPFKCGHWIVAHNGVLTNYDELIKLIPAGSYNEVDSSVIPSLLTHQAGVFETEAGLILSVLTMLKGTYSLWLYNEETRNLYIARCGSTLYANKIDNEFSSVKVFDMVELEDGSLYQRTPEGLVNVGMFQSNSPFFIL